MIQILLIPLLIAASCSGDKEADKSFTKLSPQENEKRLEECGKFEKFDPKNRKRAEVAPWLVNLHMINHKSTVFHAVLISSRHVLADFNVIDLLKGGYGKPPSAIGNCINNTTTFTGRHLSKDLIVHIEACPDCPPVEATVAHQILIGKCSDEEEHHLFLLELDRDVLGVPICLRESREWKNKFMCTQRIEKDYKLTMREAKIGRCNGDQGLCTDLSEAMPVSSIPLLVQLDQRLHLTAFGKHSDKTPNGPFNLVTELHEDLICELTGACRILKTSTMASTTTTGPLETSKATSGPFDAIEKHTRRPGPTEKSRIIVDWPPPIPTVRPAIREPTVDHLPQTDEEYEYENQLLMEYEQLEKEEREKEKEEKGTERWNVLVAVGVTVLIGLI